MSTLPRSLNQLLYKMLPSLLGLVLFLSACTGNQIEVVSSNDDSTKAAEELSLALDRLASSPASPSEYLAFSNSVSALKPRLSYKKKREAELRLVFAAFGPVLGSHELSPVEKLEKLGTTVWPEILGFSIDANESATSYLNRYCKESMHLQCDGLSQEEQLSEVIPLVYRELKEQSRRAYEDCSECQKDPSYLAVMRDFTPLFLDVVRN